MALFPWEHKQDPHRYNSKGLNLRINKIDFFSFYVGESCLCGKMMKSPFTGLDEKASDLLGLIHTDLFGPFRTIARSSERYFITFNDDFKRY